MADVRKFPQKPNTKVRLRESFETPAEVGSLDARRRAVAEEDALDAALRAELASVEKLRAIACARLMKAHHQAEELKAEIARAKTEWREGSFERVPWEVYGLKQLERNRLLKTCRTLHKTARVLIYAEDEISQLLGGKPLNTKLLIDSIPNYWAAT